MEIELFYLTIENKGASPLVPSCIVHHPFQTGQHTVSPFFTRISHKRSYRDVKDAHGPSKGLHLHVLVPGHNHCWNIPGFFGQK